MNINPDHRRVDGEGIQLKMIFLNDIKKKGFYRVALMYWDVHCHLTDSRWGEHLIPMLDNARNQGIKGFGLGGYNPEDWQKQLELKKQFPDFQWALCFGLHPVAVCDMTEAELELGLDQLAKFLGAANALGEIGLDGRTKYREQWPIQMEAFRSQLELAQISPRPIVLHSVRAHRETLQMLALHKESLAKGGFIHAFNGSKEIAQKYLDLNLALSVGGRLTHPSSQELREVVAWLPKDRLLIESDSPDQKIGGWTEELHHPTAILEIAKVVGQIRCEKPETLLEQSAKNFLTIMELTHEYRK